MTLTRKTVGKLFGHKGVSLLIAGLFVLLAGHIAWTRTFPLPYDEGYHFGLIQFYAHHLNPFLANQPAGMDSFGTVARDPSYLYHYLMSFPLRLIQLLAHTTLAQVIALRSIDIGLGVWTLGLTWKLARRLGLNRAGANLAMLFLAVTPVFFDVAGQINYDNLLIPLTLMSLLLTWRLADRLTGGTFPLALGGSLTALLLLTSLVKYSFLPIMMGIVLYVAVLSLKQRRNLHVHGSIKSLPLLAVLLLVLGASVLWVQRYGVNLVDYHTPNPQCNAVLSVQQCSTYGPWYRNYMLHETYASHPIPTLELYGFTRTWVRTMYHGLYAIVHTESRAVVFTTVRLLIDIMSGLIIVAGIYALVRFRKFVGHGLPWVFLLSVSGLYLLVLWAQNFNDFHHLGALVALQGRYLLPVLPLGYALLARCYALLFNDLQPARLRSLGAEYAIATLVGYLYIVRQLKALGPNAHTPE